MELCGQPQFMDIGFMSMRSSASLHYFAVLCIKAGHAVQVQCRFSFSTLYTAAQLAAVWRVPFGGMACRK